MALTFVQATQSAASGTTTSAVAYTTSNTLGSYLLAWIQNGAAGATLSIADSAGNTWVPVSGSQTAIGSNSWALWHCISSKGGANTVTATTSATGTGIEVGIAEYTGQAASPLDVNTTFNFLTTTTSWTSPSIKTNFTNEQLIFCGWTGVGPVITAGSGYTLEMAAGAVGAFLEDSATMAVSPGIYSATMSANTSTTLAGWLLGVKSTTSVQPPSSGDLGPGYDFKFRL